MQSLGNKGDVWLMSAKVLSAWELYGKYSRIRSYGAACQIEDKSELGRLARATVASVSACGFVGEETQISPSSSGQFSNRRRAKKRAWVTEMCDYKPPQSQPQAFQCGEPRFSPKDGSTWSTRHPANTNGGLRRRVSGMERGMAGTCRDREVPSQRREARREPWGARLNRARSARSL